jgi:Family of unknown function (DUF6941)
MRTVICALCDRATVREGLLHILGAGITTLGRPSLPAPMEVDLALLLTPDQVDELVGSHEVSVIVSSDDGTRVAESKLSFTIGPMDPVPDPLPSVPFSVALRNIILSAYGHYTVQVGYDDVRLEENRFVVEKQLAVGVTPGVESPHS